MTIQQIQARIVNLTDEGDRWHAKGMWEVSAIYYAEANRLTAELDAE